ncbi:hypothetical protein PVNG_05360 [Plasmodium vivax North Korean]|uniref:Variable surface protein Vir4 n=2 Tax=Plasmodium vivax TaxID=5855 RepID=A0A0J9TYX4_PLAVI|nr:hypothetical protein PVNG_05360 [Plasmodium vivax North Korean]
MNFSKLYYLYNNCIAIIKEFQQSLSFSGEFNSKQFYNELDELKKFSEYNKKCKPLNGTRWRKDVINTCAKLLYYLKTSKKLYMQNAQYDLCPLLNYWIYSKLNTILNSHDSTYIKLTFGEIVGIWNNFIDDELKKTGNKICEPISNIVAHDDWRYRKELYEYYVDYYPISETVKRYPDRCKEFHKYVESKKNLYDYFKKRCDSSNDNICTEFYKDYTKYDPDDVLPELSCHDKIMQEREADATRVSHNGGTFEGREPNSEDSDGRMMPDDAPKFSGNPKTVENVGNILLGVVATTMTSGALYRVNKNSLIQIYYIS